MSTAEEVQRCGDLIAPARMGTNANAITKMIAKAKTWFRGLALPSFDFSPSFA